MEAVVEGYNNQLRRMDAKERYSLLIIEIPQIAKRYGARVDLPEDTLMECISIVRQDYLSLGLEEIHTAYRLWATGKLSTGAAAEMYGGEFNARQFAAVLSAYVEYRRGILAAYLREKQEHELEQVRIETAEQMKKRLAEVFQDCLIRGVLIDLKTGRETKITTWQQVPVSFFTLAKDRGMIEYADGEKRAIWEQAKRIAEQQNREELEKAISDDRLFSLAAIREKLTEQSLEAQAISIAQKLTIYKKFIQSEH